MAQTVHQRPARERMAPLHPHNHTRHTWLIVAEPEQQRPRLGWRSLNHPLSSAAGIARAEREARSAAKDATWALKELDRARRRAGKQELRVAERVERDAQHRARVARHHAKRTRLESQTVAVRGGEEPRRRHTDRLFGALFVVFVAAAAVVLVILAMDRR